MSDNSYTERSSGNNSSTSENNSSTSGYYHRRSPRSRPRSRGLAEEPAQSRSSRRDQSAAIADYRQRADRFVHSMGRKATRSQTHSSREASPQNRRGIPSAMRETSHECPHSSSDDSFMTQLVADLWIRTNVDGFGVQDAAPSYADNESFFPNPKVTFVVDQPRNVKCAICREIPIRMTPSSTEAGETAAMILPCGHSGCVGCLTAWRSVHGTCPFCRVEHIRQCGHAVEPLVLAHDTINAIPKTTAVGGKVAAQCGPCRRESLRREAGPKFQRLVETFKRARLEASQAEEAVGSSGSDAAKAAHEATVEKLAKAQKEFERFHQDLKMQQAALASAW